MRTEGAKQREKKREKKKEKETHRQKMKPDRIEATRCVMAIISSTVR